MHDRIALGTVQFGLAYGISNPGEKTPEVECKAILEFAKSMGVRMLDTAIAYGESESILGRIGMDDWQITTKLPELPDNVHDIDRWVAEQVNASLQRLRTPSIYGLLLHCPDQLASKDGTALFAALRAQQDSGRVRKIGVSVYSPDELAELPRSMQFDIVQAPFSVFDRRMTISGWADRLVAQGGEFHARSIFLQGLLLMSQASRPDQFKPWAPLWKQWDAWLQECNLSPLAACLGYALKTPQLAKVVVGVNNLPQLREIMNTVGTEIPDPPDSLMTEDPALLNPALWKSS